MSETQIPAARRIRDSDTGFEGWRVDLRPGHGIPTPAVAGNRVLVGGGFGSHDVFALDLASGEIVWHTRTKDDGPTAAVVADGRVVFNTESCTLEVVDCATGELCWERWLGDPLLAQPAVGGERVFMVFPREGMHWLGAFRLLDGEPLWEQRLSHDGITAPVFADGLLYLSTFAGTVYCVEPSSGHVRWLRDMRATSAPWVFEGNVYVAQREDPSDSRSEERAASERVHRMRSDCGTPQRAYATKSAPYLNRRWGAARKSAFVEMDAAVGFESAPAAAKMHVSQDLVGEDRISRAWRFQGSRPVVADGVLYDTTGDRLEARDPATGEVRWSWSDASEMPGERRLTPPAVANGRIWARTWDGRLLSWDAGSGDVRWGLRLGAPCHWQPVASGGWLVAGLENGSLVAVETRDPADDGWTMWGGGPGHNGQQS